MHHKIFGALFLISPLFIFTNLAYPYTLPRWIYISVLCAAWSIALLTDIVRKKITIKTSPVDWSFIVLVLALGLSVLTSVDRTNSLWGSMERSFAFSLWPLLLVAYFGLKHALSHPETKTFLLRIHVVTVFIASIWGIVQKLLPGFSQTFSGARIGGTLGNAIFFGSYLTLSIGVICFYITQEKIRSRWLYGAYITLALGVTALLLTQTRGPLLGLSFGIFVAISTYYYLKSSKKKIVLASIIALFTLGCAAGIITYQKNMISRTTISTRLFNWNMAWNGFKEKPLLGWGPENYSRAADAHFISELTEYSIAETHADKPHNYFLELAVTSGIIGLTSYLLLLAVAIYQLFKLKLPLKQTSILCGIFAASIVQNATSFETHGSIVIFVLLLGLTNSYEKKQAKSLPIFAALTISSMLIVLLGIIPTIRDSFIFLKTLQTQGSYNTEHAAITDLQKHTYSTPFPHDYITAISFEIVGQFWQNPTAYAQLSETEKLLHAQDIEWLRKTLTDFDSLHPNDGAWKITLANSAYQLFSLTHDTTDGAVAEKLFSDYSRIAPNRQEALMQLGQLSLLKNNPDMAVTYLDSTINLDPKFQTPYWQRSLALFAVKKTPLAWKDIEYLMSTNYVFAPPQLANYVYNQLLSGKLTTEATAFRTYFEGSF